jgi:hypothetical protein
LARSLGKAAHGRVTEDYLMIGSLMSWASLVRLLVGAAT